MSFTSIPIFFLDLTLWKTSEKNLKYISYQASYFSTFKLRPSSLYTIVLPYASLPESWCNGNCSSTNHSINQPIITQHYNINCWAVLWLVETLVVSNKRSEFLLHWRSGVRKYIRVQWRSSCLWCLRSCKPFKSVSRVRLIRFHHDDGSPL